MITPDFDQRLDDFNEREGIERDMEEYNRQLLENMQLIASFRKIGKHNTYERTAQEDYDERRALGFTGY